MDNSKKMGFKKWLTFAVLIPGAGTIYKLGFLKDAFYVPMQEYMGLSHTQIGTATSISGFISIIGYLVAAYLADRFSKKYVIPVALCGVGLTGFYLSTFPPYPAFLACYCIMAICCDMLFWPVMLKTVRLLGTKEEQGRMFGFLESGRGLVDTIVAFSALGIFAAFGSQAKGLKSAIIFYSILPIIFGILSYFLLEHDEVKDVNENGEKVGKNKIAFENMLMAMKNKKIWLVAINAFAVYSVYCGITYFVPFLKDVYAMPVILVGSYGIINQYGLKLFGGPIGGFLSDKAFKSPARFLRTVFLITGIIMLIFIKLPHQRMHVYVGMGIALCIGALVFCMRAVFFAPMDEVGVPRQYTGSAMSLGAFIGYLPGAFLYILYGNILDHNPGLLGYKIVFSTTVVFAIFGFLISFWLVTIVKKEQHGQPHN